MRSTISLPLVAPLLAALAAPAVADLRTWRGDPIRAETIAERAPAAHWIELDLGFTKSEIVDVPTGTQGQTSTEDLAAHWQLGGGFGVGAALELVPWRNYQTAFLGDTNHVLSGLALARYERAPGSFHPYAQVGGGLGQSTIAPHFTIFEPRFKEGPWGWTTNLDRTGLAWTVLASAGIREDIGGGWCFVGELGVERLRMRHRMIFRQEAGPTTYTEHVGVDQLAFRFGVARTF